MKLPNDATKVFQGKIFAVYQWEQKLYDGTTATFEMLQRPGTIQIIPTAGENIYLSYEEQPTKTRSYTLFGGRQEKNEDALVTAKRELLEETGLESQDWELLKEYQNQGKIDWPMSIYIARNCHTVTKQKLDPGEKIDIKTVTFREFTEIVSSEDFWGQNFSNDILRMRLNEKKLDEFKIKLFT